MTAKADKIMNLAGEMYAIIQEMQGLGITSFEVGQTKSNITIDGNGNGIERQAKIRLGDGSGNNCGGKHDK